MVKARHGIVTSLCPWFRVYLLFTVVISVWSDNVTHPSVTSSQTSPSTVNPTGLNQDNITGQLNVTIATADAGPPLWSQIFDNCQLAFIIVGLVANLATLVTLFRNGADFSRPVRILFRHQSFADALVCLMACIIMLQPFMWLTGVYIIDVFICYAWHGQAFYWTSVTLSTYNLVLISFERYTAVCRPFEYTELCAITRKRVALNILILYVFSLGITHGTFIQTRLTNGTCLPEYAFDGDYVEVYFKFFVVFTYITTYFCPVAIMAGFYGKVALSLRRRGKDKRLAQSKTIDRASTELAKTAFTVTIIFILTIGYDLHYYLFGYIGVTEYILNSPIQKVGVFLSNLNSCANPFVYALLMPMFRASLMKTFGCRRKRPNTETENSRGMSRGNASLASSQQTISSNMS